MRLRTWMLAPMLGAAAGAVVLGVSASSVEPQPAPTREQELLSQFELFAEVMSRVRSDYVYEVDEAELIESAIQGMLKSLDPHSGYLAVDDYVDLQERTRGNYGGLGLTVTLENDLVKVVSPIDDTPAARAGITANDFIIAIDGQPIVGLDLDEAVDRMKGDPGSTITVTIAREGEENFDVTMTREEIVVKPVSWRVESETVGYIRISTFNELAGKETVAAVSALDEQLGDSLTGVVLDLRDNPGGVLEQAIEVADAFLDGGEVVSTRGRSADDITPMLAGPVDLLDGRPIVVLINEGSASAAEIVAGALQDRRRARLVGMTSFGKGSVQSVVPLRSSAGALRLTTAKYYTPAGRSIQATGIEPDVVVAASAAAAERRRRRLSERDLPNAIANDTAPAEPPAGEVGEPSAEIELPPEDFPEDGDFQLQRGIEILREIAISEGRGTRQG